MLALSGTAVVACGSESEPESGPLLGDVQLIIRGARQESSPLGWWCVQRVGDGVAVTPIVPKESGGKPIMGGRWDGGAGAIVAQWWNEEGRWAAKLDGCVVGDGLPLDLPSPSWSSNSLVYLTRQDESLWFGKLGGTAQRVEADDVLSFAWNPTGDAFLYARRTDPAGTNIPAPAELFYVEVTSDGGIGSNVLIDTEASGGNWSPRGDRLLFKKSEQEPVFVWDRSTRKVSQFLASGTVPSSEFVDATGEQLMLVTRDARQWVVRLSDGFEVGLSSDNGTWLHPYPWVYRFSTTEPTELWDVTDLGNVEHHQLATGVKLVPSPRKGEGLKLWLEDGIQYRQFLRGIPNEMNAIGDVWHGGPGVFSPDGRFWGSVAVDIEQRDNALADKAFLVTEVAAGASPSEIFAPGKQYIDPNNVTWLSPESFAILYYEPDAKRHLLRLASFDGTRWKTSDVSLPDISSSHMAELFQFEQR